MPHHSKPSQTYHFWSNWPYNSLNPEFLRHLVKKLPLFSSLFRKNSQPKKSPGVNLQRTAPKKPPVFFTGGMAAASLFQGVPRRQHLGVLTLNSGAQGSEDRRLREMYFAAGSAISAPSASGGWRDEVGQMGETNNPTGLLQVLRLEKLLRESNEK